MLWQNVGYVASVVSVDLALYAVVAALVGARRRTPELVVSARNAALSVTVLLTLVAVLEYLLISGDFRTLYVASVSNRAMPVFFKMTALWGSQAGSLLFWSWLMSLFSGAVLLRKWGKMRTLMPLHCCRDPDYIGLLYQSHFAYGRCWPRRSRPWA
jgi:cytochrome c-type biogenesis protein CcmF